MRSSGATRRISTQGSLWAGYDEKLAGRAPALEILVRPGRLPEGVPAGDADAQGAVGQPAEYLVSALAQLVQAGDVVGQGGPGEEHRAGTGQPERFDRRYRAARRPVRHEVAAWAKALEGCVEGVGAHAVVADRDPFAVGEVADGVDGLVVAHDQVRAGLPGQRRLRRRRRGADHPAAEVLDHLGEQ